MEEVVTRVDSGHWGQQAVRELLQPSISLVGMATRRPHYPRGRNGGEVEL